ncbi:MAG: hypothetical protein V4664_01360 [Patescibacteria group bacterium]
MSTPETVTAESLNKLYLSKNIGDSENPEDNRLSLETSVGQVEVISNMGGEESKYKRNEDSAFVLCHDGVVTCGVIDGAGGSGNGYLASSIANAAFRESLMVSADFKIAVKFADEEVRRNGNDLYATATAVQIKETEKGGQYEVDVMGVGDAKTMIVRGDIILREGTTEPQNVAYKALLGSDNEQGYYTHPKLNIITGGLGVPEPELHDRPRFKAIVAESGDIIVMASDGLWDNVSEYEIVEIIKKAEHDPKKIEQEIFKLAYERNNSKSEFIIQHDAKTTVNKTIYKEGKKKGDNITVAVIGLK